MRKFILFCLITGLSNNAANAQTEVTFYTNMGDFVVETYDTLQPITTGNFIELVTSEFYDGVIFHRIISGFVIQGGDPQGTGFGGPGYTIPDEFDPLASNVQYSISMANSGPNTGGSQFFINLVNNLFLDTNHPVFGIVTSNFDVVESIGIVPTNSNDRPLTDVIMDSVRVTLNGPILSTNEHLKPSLNLSVFPNPADDFISISIADKNSNSNNYLMTITDLLGQIIYSEYLGNQNSTVDVSQIETKGIYFVNILDEQTNARATKKLVIR